MTGSSSAANWLIRLAGSSPPSLSLVTGNPRSPCGPPTLSYFASTCPVTTFAPVSGV